MACTKGSTVDCRNPANAFSFSSLYLCFASANRRLNSGRPDCSTDANASLSMCPLLCFQPPEVVRIPLVQVFQFETIIVKIAVELAPFRHFLDQSLDFHQSRPHF